MQVKTAGPGHAQRAQKLNAAATWQHETTCSSCGSVLVLKPEDLDRRTGHAYRTPSGPGDIIYNMKATCAVCGAEVAVPEVPRAAMVKPEPRP